MVSVKKQLCASSALGGTILLITALAPSFAAAQERPAAGQQVEEVVITGSRIRTTDTTTPAPVNILSPKVIEDRGFTQVGQALNETTSITPSLQRNTGIGSPVANVQNYPNLFNLGAGRTLSLVNGRRMVTTASGLDDAAVDTNIIPLGLLERVDIVQGGGAAVYGSGAIAGVVNYVLKKNFEGATVDAQYSITSKGDYPIYSFRGTVGHNFLDGRANVAVNVDYSKSDSLLFTDRERSAEVPFAGTNPANKTATDGIPATVYFTNTKTWSSSFNGILWKDTGNTAASLLQVGGKPVQFDAAGTSLIPYNTGTIVFSNLAQGGDGVDYNSKSSLFAGVERFAGTLIGNYKLTDDINLSTELLFARTRSSDPRARSRPLQFDNTGAAAGGTFSFDVTNKNAYLTPTEIAQLNAASPTFASGGTIYLGKFFSDLIPTTNQTTETQTWRALISADGSFNRFGRNFDWNVSFSGAGVDYNLTGWSLNQQRLRNAANAVKNSSGQIVCAINAVTVVDPNCAPLNIFGTGTISDAARQYVIVQSGQAQGATQVPYSNDQTDFLASLSGDVVKLPAGEAKFNVTYEHRTENVDAIPLEADRLGLIGAQAPTPAVTGKYNTNELAGELLVPVISPDMNIPLMRGLDLNGSYRFVDDSIAGKEKVWGLGLRWDVGYGLTIRSSLSRNFRAPTLNQLIAPATQNVSTATNPCSNTAILSGSNPAVRQANCLALFTANPAFGATTANPAGSSAAARLAGFNDIGNNFRRVLVTTSGNPDLKNEISHTLTYGLVYQPSYVPGLTLTIDRIQLDLRGALSSFTATSFLATCFDSAPQPAGICATSTFNPDGTLATGTATTYNAGFVKYHGTIYNLNYRFDLARALRQDADYGQITFGVDATNNTMRISSVTGLDLTRTHHTTSQPFWVVKPTIQWVRGPLRVNYTMFYLPSEPQNYTDTVENASILPVKANIRHNISTEYRFSKYAVRFGINNFTDEPPSFPYGAGYGDIIGRQYFVGLKANF
jgi:iron complex outermembrane receptor protein